MAKCISPLTYMEALLVKADFALLLVDVFAKLFAHVNKCLSGGRERGGWGLRFIARGNLSKSVVHK